MTILLTGSTTYAKCTWLTIAVCSRPQATLPFTSCLGTRPNSQWISFTDPHAWIYNQPHHPPVTMHYDCRPTCSQLLMVRDHASTHHQRQKVFYDQKVYGKPYMPGDLVWLYSPVPQKGTSRKLYHPWTGPFKVVKKVSDVTYRIQQQQGRRTRKIVHFDCLKPCSGNIQLSSTHTQINSEDTTAQPDNHRSVTHTFGNHTELLDEDDDNDAAPSQVIGHATPAISV